jgi:DNA-binding MarR family transcriptional regulator
MLPGSRRPPSLLAHPSYLASQVSKYGRRQLEAVLDKHGLALVHHAVLSALDDFGPLSQQELADSLDLDKSRLVAWIDELESRGLVRREPDKFDRRRKQVTLTPAGQALTHDVKPAARRSQKGFLDVLSPTEQKTLISLLQRVLGANDAARANVSSERPLPDQHPVRRRAAV